MYGAPWCPDCRRAKAFLSEHRVPYDWIDLDHDAEALRYVQELQNGGRSIPMLLFEDSSSLVEPTNEELARKLHLKLEAERSFYDLAIIGSGPAGLAAAIYAAREGIGAIVIDRSALGGQAGVTERIDNYPGFRRALAAPSWRSASCSRRNATASSWSPAVGVDEVNTGGPGRAAAPQQRTGDLHARGDRGDRISVSAAGGARRRGSHRRRGSLLRDL